MNKIFQVSVVALLAFAYTAQAFYDSGKGGEIKAAAVTTTEDTNPKAIVYKLEGTAVITKAGTPEEKKLKKGDEIGAGDSVSTHDGASLSIRFDAESLNTVTIPSGSKAVFKSISPVSVYL